MSVFDHLFGYFDSLYIYFHNRYIRRKYTKDKRKLSFSFGTKLSALQIKSHNFPGCRERLFLKNIDIENKKISIIIDFGRYVYDFNNSKYTISITSSSQHPVLFPDPIPTIMTLQIYESITDYNISSIYSVNKSKLSRQWVIEFEYKEHFFDKFSVEINKRVVFTDEQKKKIWKIKDHIKKNQ